MGRPKNTVERMLVVDVDTSGDCWIWKGPMHKNGYGKPAISRRTHLAHRVFYTHFKGPIPDGQQIGHTCKNTACVNPAHLEAATQADIIYAGESPSGCNSRKQVCLRGHSLLGENLYVTPDGRRQCKTCRAAADAKSKEKHFAKNSKLR